MIIKDYVIYSLEDDPSISHLLELALKGQGYDFRAFLDYASFKETFAKKKPNMVLLDLMLPEKSGEDILKEIRSDPSNDEIQILVVSAKKELINKVDVLNNGADDYICKPFDIMELLSRIASKARRYIGRDRIVMRNVTFDSVKQILSRGNQDIKLTQSERTILFLLVQNIGSAVSRDELIKVLWGDGGSVETRALDMHIKEIRRKLAPDGDLIETVYGIGYKLKNE